jgi:CobQ/CobB/MinD/ParA nucleotide binding domain
MKIFIIQSKGGVGKSYLTKLLSLKADKDETKTYFIDCDNASASTTKFFRGIEERKSPYILFKSENLLGADKKIDRTKFDTFLGTVEKLENVIVDFGAASSEQLLYYIQEESKNDILETLQEIGVNLFLVVAGGGSIKESIEFALELKKIKGIEKLVTVVANEYLGGVNGNSVSEYSKADIQINSLHDDTNSEAQKEWNDLMNSGVVYADIQSMTLIRRKRIVSYLDSIFAQVK